MVVLTKYTQTQSLVHKQFEYVTLPLSTVEGRNFQLFDQLALSMADGQLVLTNPRADMARVHPNTRCEIQSDS